MGVREGRIVTLFGSPNVIVVQDVCHAPREVASIHTCGFYPVVDFHQKSRLIVLWGSNVTSSNEEGQICSRRRKSWERNSARLT